MAGRPQFELIVAQAPREEMAVVNLSSNDPVSAGQSEVIDFFGPANTICEINQFYFRADYVSGASSGQHEFVLDDTVAAGGFVRGVSNFNNNVTWCYGSFFEATKEQNPSGAAAQLAAVRSARFNDTIGIRIKYANGTNATQTKKREFRMSYVMRTVS